MARPYYQHDPSFVVQNTQMAAPQDAERTTTVTVTATVGPELSTMTIGRPWTTATPRVYTTLQRDWQSRGGDTFKVVEIYPPQYGHVVYPACRSHKGAIVGALFGGIAIGLVISTIALCAWRIRRNWRSRRANNRASDEAVRNGSPKESLAPREDILVNIPDAQPLMSGRHGSPKESLAPREDVLVNIPDAQPLMSGRHGSPKESLAPREDVLVSIPEEQPLMSGRPDEGRSGA